jgi:NAD(P)-dependent dehydrogenase (short-subunit alcohol dehydrogenase family)
MRLEGKVAVITGGGTGIGAATARRFAREGAKVVVTGRRPEPLEAIATETGGVAVAGDAADPAHAQAAVETAVERFGGLHVVVANAGLGFGESVVEVTDDHWGRTLDVNLTGPLLLARAALPTLIGGGGGSIVVVSSIAAVVGSPDSAAYMASKAGLLGLVRSVAVDYGPLGVRANAVLPGWVATDIGDRGADELAAREGVSREVAYATLTQDVPLRRPGTPDEIAACCSFLASDESSFVTGAMLAVDGGSTAVDVGTLAFAPNRWEVGEG